MKTLVLQLPQPVRIPSAPATPRAREVALRFGIAPQIPTPAPAPQTLALPFPSLTLITGPSGTGKSTLLAQISAAARPHLRIARLSAIRLPRRRPLIDCFPTPIDLTMSLLSRAGLAEPRLWLQSPATLSEGERFRFRLARLIASRAQLLIADEFAALLDRVTARAIAHQFSRYIHTSTRAALLATSHEDLAQDLHPTRHIHMNKYQNKESST